MVGNVDKIKQLPNNYLENILIKHIQCMWIKNEKKKKKI